MHAFVHPLSRNAINESMFVLHTSNIRIVLYYRDFKIWYGDALLRRAEMKITSGDVIRRTHSKFPAVAVECVTAIWAKRRSGDYARKSEYIFMLFSMA